jgi:hypothetical protein
MVKQPSRGGGLSGGSEKPPSPGTLVRQPQVPARQVPANPPSRRGGTARPRLEGPAAHKTGEPLRAVPSEPHPMPPNRIIPKAPFTTANVVFIPGKEYLVSDAIYNSTIESVNKKFSELVTKV